MKTIPLVVTLLTLAIAAPAQGGGVAILDIDEVARRLGVEEKVRADLLSFQGDLNQRLQQEQEALQNQMIRVERAAGENPTEEQRREILAANQQLNAEFNRTRAQAESLLAEERIRLINEFRISLEPIAMQAAEAKGLRIVLMKVTPPIFTYASEVDITDSTTELAIAAGLNVDPPAAPAGGTAPGTPEAPEAASEAAPEAAAAPASAAPEESSEAPAPAPENP